MIGAHAGGIDHSYKRLNKTQARCLFCGQYSECQIIKYTRSFHFFYIRLKVLEEQFIFDWEACKHRAILFDKEDSSRYKREQVNTGLLLVPYYQNIRLQFTSTPKKISALDIILIILFTLALGVIFYLTGLFDTPFLL